jgi:hypothetical protein
MTARSGDALSHLYFRVLQSAVLTEISAPKILRPAHRASSAMPAEILPVVFAWRP